jgi:uncharacterized protein YidB (DUF937 family)
MGVLEQLMGGLSGADEAMHPHLMQAVQGLIGNEESIGPGLQGLIDRLRAHGYGGMVDTWLSSATNLPLTTDQLREALGDDEVRATAQRAGLSEDTLLATLAEHLPSVIDRLSTEGNLLPAEAHATSSGI